MKRKNLNKKSKIIILIAVVLLIAVVTTIIVQNVIISGQIEETEYLAIGNENSNHFEIFLIVLIEWLFLVL